MITPIQACMFKTQANSQQHLSPFPSLIIQQVRTQDVEKTVLTILIISLFGHGAFALTGIAVSKDDNPYITNFSKVRLKSCKNKVTVVQQSQSSSQRKCRTKSPKQRQHYVHFLSSFLVVVTANTSVSPIKFETTCQHSSLFWQVRNKRLTFSLGLLHLSFSLTFFGLDSL